MKTVQPPKSPTFGRMNFPGPRQRVRPRLSAALPPPPPAVHQRGPLALPPNALVSPGALLLAQISQHGQLAAAAAAAAGAPPPAPRSEVVEHQSPPAQKKLKPLARSGAKPAKEADKAGGDEATGDVMKTVPRACGVDTDGKHVGRWTREEHEAFLLGLRTYGREWKKVAQNIKTRTSAQIRSHAQKYFAKLSREGREAFPGSSKWVMEDDSAEASDSQERPAAMPAPATQEDLDKSINDMLARLSKRRAELVRRQESGRFRAAARTAQRSQAQKLQGLDEGEVIALQVLVQAKGGLMPPSSLLNERISPARPRSSAGKVHGSTSPAKLLVDPEPKSVPNGSPRSKFSRQTAARTRHGSGLLTPYAKRHKTIRLSP